MCVNKRERGREKEKSLIPIVITSQDFGHGVCFSVVDKHLIHTSGASSPSYNVFGLHRINSLVESQCALRLQRQGMWYTTLISCNLLFHSFYKGSLFGRLLGSLITLPFFPFQNKLKSVSFTSPMCSPFCFVSSNTPCKREKEKHCIKLYISCRNFKMSWQIAEINAKQ